MIRTIEATQFLSEDNRYGSIFKVISFITVNVVPQITHVNVSSSIAFLVDTLSFLQFY